jgi:hypothetical protein
MPKLLRPREEFSPLKDKNTMTTNRLSPDTTRLLESGKGVELLCDSDM